MLRIARVVALESKRQGGTAEFEDSSLADKAYRELEELIVTGQLAPKDVLSESSLADRLKIGRTPVREALHRLAREGLVVILPRRGILVSDVNIQTQLELLEARREIERLMARLAAARIFGSQKEQFLAIASEMDRVSAQEDGTAFIRLDRQLNLLLSAAAQNDFLHRAMGLMHGLSRRFWFLYYEEAADLPLCARLHADLARSVADGNEVAAGAAAGRLNDFNERFTRAALDSKRKPRGSNLRSAAKKVDMSIGRRTRRSNNPSLKRPGIPVAPE